MLDLRMPNLLDIVRNPKGLLSKLSSRERVHIFAIAVMQLGLLGALIFSLFVNDWLAVFITVIGLACVWLLPLLARSWRMHVPLEFEFLLNIFIYATIFLGEIHGYYTRFWWWDNVLHFSSGLALGFIGFLIMFSLYKGDKLQAHPFILSLFAFGFALSLGALWEIFEFTMDRLFETNMQKTMLGDTSGLTDTMYDLIIDTFGALLVSVSGYFYIRNRRSGLGIFQRYISLYFHKDN